MKKFIPHILLVEDNPAHAELVKRSLPKTQLKMKLTHVKNGEEVISFFKNNSCPHLILLDLKLPKMNGQAVLKYIKGHDTLKKIPVVILTTSSSMDDIRQAYLNHANGYLIKPTEFSEFQKIIEKTCNYWLKCNKVPF